MIFNALKKEVERNPDWLQHIDMLPITKVSEINCLLEITYLMARACDIARYGKKVADITFPQPSLAGVTSKRVTDTITNMVTALQDIERKKQKEYEDNMYSWAIPPELERP